jgi:hypothetical protein
MSDSHNGKPARLEAYLDALSSNPEGVDRPTLMRWIEQDPDLRSELEIQERVDSALRRSFAAPAAANVLALIAARQAELLARAASAAPPVSIPDAGARPQAPVAPHPEAPAKTAAPAPRGGLGRAGWRASINSWPVALAAAAALAVALGTMGPWLRDQFRSALPPRSVQPQVVSGSAEVHYRRTVAQGFRPEARCGSGGDVAEVMRKRVGASLAVKDPPEGVELVGVSCGPFTRAGAASLLARVGNTPVVVLADHAAPGDKK